MNILQYREFINSECSNHSHTILTKKAIKLDGKNSLKMAIGCKDLKSSDYLKYKKNEILLLEISDLAAQLESLFKKTNSIAPECKKNLGDKLTKKITPKNIIQDELREKYIQTILILYKLKDHIRISLDKAKVYVVALCSTNISDVRAFQYLVNHLKASLKGLLDDVKVVPISLLVSVV